MEVIIYLDREIKYHKMQCAARWDFAQKKPAKFSCNKAYILKLVLFGINLWVSI